MQIQRQAPKDHIFPSASNFQFRPPAQESATPALDRYNPTWADPSGPEADALAAIRAKVQSEVDLQGAAAPSGLRLRRNAESFFAAAEGDAKGTVVMYHGFTAGPWQCRELAHSLKEQGFNVYAKRMPGHGMVDDNGQPADAEMPRSAEDQRWTEFVDETFSEVAGLGAPVYAVGLSGGANVALSTAARHKEVAGVVALAPFIGGDGALGMLLPVLNLVDMVTFGLFGKLLDAIPRGKDVAKGEDDPTPRTSGTWGQALSMYRLGNSVERVEAPLQLITTHGDLLSGVKRVGKLLENSGPREKNGWFHFGAEEKVKHAMLSPPENPDRESISTIEAIITDFASRGRLAERPPR